MVSVISNENSKYPARHVRNNKCSTEEDKQNILLRCQLPVLVRTQKESSKVKEVDYNHSLYYFYCSDENRYGLYSVVTT